MGQDYLLPYCGKMILRCLVTCLRLHSKIFSLNFDLSHPQINHGQQDCFPVSSPVALSPSLGWDHLGCWAVQLMFRQHGLLLASHLMVEPPAPTPWGSFLKHIETGQGRWFSWILDVHWVV